MSVEAKITRISSDLKLTNLANSAGQAKQVQALPDSWDDEVDDDAPEAPGPTLKHITTIESQGPPPPTPVSPTNTKPINTWSKHHLDQSESSDAGKRPEKSTATANRLIAGALGVKAPPKTAEQKQYDAAVRENERKRRDKERADKENARLEAERAKADVWNS